MMTKAEVLLGRLIEERLTAGTDIATIDRRIRAEFEEEWCIVYTNMAATTAPMATDAIINYLCLVHEMKRMTRPIMEAMGGVILKVFADRFVALFRRPHDAMNALLQVNRRLASYNDAHPSDTIAVGAGLGFGKVLKIGSDDVFGTEVGYASRLGGELARPYEILVSDATRAALLHAPGIAFEPPEREAGFPAFRARYDLKPQARPTEDTPADGREP